MPSAPRAIVIGLDAVPLRLLRRFADEGSLPHIARLFQQGACAEVLPCIPAYTPNNWACLATGAWPGTHGAINWHDLAPGDPPNRQPRSTFFSEAITAESIWEAAERAGLRSLIIAFPGAWPPRLRSGFVIAPLPDGLVSLAVLPGALYTTTPPQRPHERPLTLHEPAGWRHLPTGHVRAGRLDLAQEAARRSGGRAATHVGAVEDGAALEHIPEAAKTSDPVTPPATLYLLVVPASAGHGPAVLVTAQPDAARPLVVLDQPDRWSPWVFFHWPRPEGPLPVACRFRLLDLSPDGSHLRLLRSEVYPTRGFTWPADLAEPLVNALGPYFEHPALPPSEEPQELAAIFEELSDQALWHARAAAYLLEHGGWDLYFSHWHWPDTAQHAYLALADPSSPHFDPARAPLAMEALRRSYQIADAMLGAFWELAGDQTYIALVSDHGNVPNTYACDLARRLAECNLLVFADRQRGQIDYTRSLAYPLGGLMVCVNLKGRDPFGLVEPADYSKVQEAIIDALLTWREPATGKRVVALALTRRDAALLGFWGPRTGDVVFLYNQGFAWVPVQGESSVSPAPPSANHGPQPPTATSALSSNAGTFLIRGPGVKAGYERDYQRLGWPRTIDIVPTLCALLGVRPPRHAQGTVLWDLLAEEHP